MIRRFNTLLAILALAAAYFCAGHFGLSFASINKSASAIWPPTGIALAALLLWGYRLWPGIFLGAFLVNVLTTGDLLTDFGIAAGNTLEALCGAWLVNRFARGRQAFERARDVFLYLLFAAVLSTTVSATFGVTSLALRGFAHWSDFLPIWVTWWLGDAASAIIVTPLIVIWSTKPFPRWTRLHLAEGALMLAVALTVSILAFGGSFAAPASRYPRFLIFPVLLWASYRFGQRGAITAVLVVSCIAIWGTLRGFGPLVGPNPNDSLLLLQTFVATATITNLVLGAVVSQHKNSEEALRRSETRFRTLADSAPVLIWMSGTDKLCTWFNKPWLDFVGRSLEQEAGNGWVENVHPNDFDRCLQTYVTAFDARREFTREYRLKRHDGQWRWLLDHGIPLHGANREFTGYIGSCIDITERKLAETALLTKESELKLVTDITPVLLTRCSRELRYEFVNRAYARMLGLTPEQVAGKPIVEIMGAEGYERIRPYVEKVLQGQPVVYDDDVPYKRIGLRSVRAVYMPDRDEQGNVRGWLASITDVTEHKRAEQAQRLLATIVETSEIAIISKTLEGVVTSWNKGAERIFGYTAAEMVGQSVNRIVGADRQQEAEGILKRIGRGEHVEQYETLRVRKDGKVIGISMTVSPIYDETGKIIGASKIAGDISEVVKARETLAQRQAELERTVQERTAQLQELVRELETFSYTISHDLRAPLRTMHSFSSLLLESTTEKLTAEELDFLRRIVAASSRMDSLIRDVLNYSRTARIEMRLGPVDLDKLTRDIIEQYPGFQQPQAEIVIKGKLPLVVGHEAALTQCVSNLLGNAVKFTESGTVPRVEIRAECNNGDARVWFADNGIGIAHGDRERIFRIFERLHPGDKYAGTGIGLSIVKRAVERMGGKVGLESEMGKGSRFWIQLPTGSKPIPH